METRSHFSTGELCKMSVSRELSLESLELISSWKISPDGVWIKLDGVWMESGRTPSVWVYKSYPAGRLDGSTSDANFKIPVCSGVERGPLLRARMHDTAVQRPL